MSYFKYFPLTRYTIDNQELLGVDITKKTDTLDIYRNDNRFYIEYTIKDSEYPQEIADKIYEDANMAWLILLFNQIDNVYDKWPMSQQALVDYVNDVYVDPYDIHHYESTQGNIVLESWPTYDRIPVTNFEYEEKLNESKRSIKILIPELVSSIISQHRQLMEQS